MCEVIHTRNSVRAKHEGFLTDHDFGCWFHNVLYNMFGHVRSLHEGTRPSMLGKKQQIILIEQSPLRL